MRVPTNLVTGFLGVGKTTAIRHWISQKPDQERWAILVNEFGEVGIDGAVLEASAPSGIAVSEIAGGCFCCSTDAPVEITILELIRQTEPHRILIEPTGLGHPAKTLDALKGAWLRPLIDLRATVCLADPRDFDNPQITNEQVFRDQLHLADVVAVNKTDQCEAEALETFLTFLQQMFPPKSLIVTTTFGHLDLSVLDCDITPERAPLFPEAHPVQTQTHRHQSEVTHPSGISLLLPGHPLRKQSAPQGRAACGWIFSPLDSFRKVDLFELLSGSFDVHRLKGVFNVGNEWLFFNRVGGDLTCESIPYRRDSRLEVILDQSDYDWDHFERLLLKCLKTRPDVG